MLDDVPSPQIISLVPSATEMMFRLGAGDELVGRSHVCDFPTEVRTRPVLTRPRLESTSSRGIHDELRTLLSSGLAIYDVDLERLRSLEPTHLLIQDQCSVCAVAPSDLEAALSDWLGTKPELVTLAPHQLHEVWRDIETIGAAIGRASEADSLRRTLADELCNVVESIPEAPVRPRVACLEWIDPLMIAGHWIPELVRVAGGDPILSQTGAPSTTIDVPKLIAAAPDIIVVQVCGFDLKASLAAWRDQRELHAALGQIRGTPPRVFVTDGDAFFNRPGPRLVESAQILADILHPNREEESRLAQHWVAL